MTCNHCEYWDAEKQTCTDKQQYVTPEGSPYCGRREDAVPVDGLITQLRDKIARLMGIIGRVESALNDRMLDANSSAMEAKAILAEAKAHAPEQGEGKGEAK